MVKKTDKSDYLGETAMRNGDFDGAINLLAPYCQKYPKADAALFDLGLSYLQAAQAHRDGALVQKGIDALNQCVALNNENSNAIQYLAMGYEMIGNKPQADLLKNRLRELQGQ